jgi:DNA-directed RNA polymerase specialized sigma24 family protein
VSELKQILRRLPAEQILELVQRYREGAPVRELAAVFSINRTTVLAHLERQGVPRRPNVTKLSPADIAEAARLYASGLSTVKIGAHFGVDAETVRKALHKAGVRLRPRRGDRRSGSNRGNDSL